MPMNRVQFQSGLSMPDFLQQFGTETQCAAAVEQARWPEGFSCPQCGHAAHTVLNAGLGSRKTFQCQACRHQTSLIAGTLFQSTHLPLTLCFLAIYLISEAKTGLSSLALKRTLGVSYPTAWRRHHKLMQAMAERETLYTLEGQVQVDDAYSESLFKTLKYRPDYPVEKPFDTLEEARKWVSSFTGWYNEEHRHSAIKFVTPSQRHRGEDREILTRRDRTYQEDVLIRWSSLRSIRR